MQKPYVVSADIHLALSSWVTDQDLVLPDQRFFSDLRGSFNHEMKTIFHQYDFIEEAELKEGIRHLVESVALPVVSLDRLYYQSPYNLELARSVDLAGRSVGLFKRPESESLLLQLNRLKYAGLTDVILLDDVVFSGDLAERVVKLLRLIGVMVKVVITGVVITEGRERLQSLGCKVLSVCSYDAVIDEVCERDFYPGVSQSGRVLHGAANTGVPYLLPFGDPVGWGSVPEEFACTFSKNCLNRTMTLFEEIERLSGRTVMNSELGRRVKGFVDSDPFVSSLRQLL